MQHQIDNTNKNINLVHQDLKNDIKDVRNEMNQNVHYIYSDIKSLNNKIDIQSDKINEELKVQNARITSNEVTISYHEKMLYRLCQSNEKQKDIILQHDLELNNHQNMILSCLENIKYLYKDAEELKINMLSEEKKLNELAQKNDKEISLLKQRYQDSINQINTITDVLNNHTQVLAEHSTAIAQLQAISYKHDEKIDEINKNLFNHEARIQNLENRLDKVEAILKEHQKVLCNLTGEIKEMRDIVNNIVQRIEKLETKMIEERAENKADKIQEFLEKFNEDKLVEFSEFIIDIRNQPEPFNLDDIIKGIKIIFNKKNKNSI